MSDGGKGSARRPGNGYAEGYDRIFGKRRWYGTELVVAALEAAGATLLAEEPKCKCEFTKMMLGNGCGVCNPEFWARMEKTWAAEDAAQGEKDDGGSDATGN